MRKKIRKSKAKPKKTMRRTRRKPKRITRGGNLYAFRHPQNNKIYVVSKTGQTKILPDEFTALRRRKIIKK